MIRRPNCTQLEIAIALARATLVATLDASGDANAEWLIRNEMRREADEELKVREHLETAAYCALLNAQTVVRDARAVLEDLEDQLEDRARMERGLTDFLAAQKAAGLA